jgi:hypothetical protein
MLKSSSLCLHISNLGTFSSETTEPISTKLCWNDSWMSPFQNCVRWSRLLTKMAAKLKIEKKGMKFLKHFLLWNYWAIHPPFFYLKLDGFLAWKSGSPDTFLEGGHPRTIPPKFGCNWPSGFWREDLYQHFRPPTKMAATAELNLT